VNPISSLLLTDLYQLTMLQGYMEHGMEKTAVFELFVRKLPPGRNFFLAAGLEQALDFLEQARFTEAELQWIAESGRFSKAFADYLSRLRFTGNVFAIPEGRVFFPNEPLARVIAPLPEAQLVESRLINLLQYPTLVASKAARCVLAAPGKLLVDFGMRRSHGAEAALLAARAGYIAGLDGTSTVLAAPVFGIPVFGTMAHSFIQAHESESAAFEQFAKAQPENVVLLIDTYDTQRAAQKVVRLAPRLAEVGIRVKGVRIDSGDLGLHAKKVREILDRGAQPGITIFASSNLDEYALRELLRAGAPIDGFGIGTRLDTSADRPYLDCAYKLQEYAGVARRKRSEGKATWPGRKQVYRYYDAEGHMRKDLLTLEQDWQDEDALLQPVMRSGKRLERPEPLSQVRTRAAQELTRLPEALRSLDAAEPYPVEVSSVLRELAAKLDARPP
jgi:nicotinate phosphoribosyltransferase